MNLNIYIFQIPLSAPRNLHSGKSLGFTGFTSIWIEALFPANVKQESIFIATAQAKRKVDTFVKQAIGHAHGP